MFLHLGEDVIVPKKNIIGIFDFKTCLNSGDSKEFLNLAKTEKKIKQIGTKAKIKSFIITNEDIYLSPISSSTLLKRFLKLFEF